MSSSRFEKVAIKEVRKETDDCVSVLLDIPHDLREKFSYTAGQHITLRTILGGEEVRRSYSLCSSPLHDEWRIAVKKVDGGIFSEFANYVLQPGDSIEVMQPSGRFILRHTNEAKHYIFFAAGSGITPVLSILKTGLIKQTHSSFTLIYGNRTRQSIIFKEEIEALKNKYMSRLHLIHILSREHTESPLNEGRIDAEKCEQIFNHVTSLHADAYFLCGPEQMIFRIRDWLESKNIERDKIHFELFGSALALEDKKSKDVAQYNGGESSNITIHLDGRSFSFNLPFNGMCILDAALQQGADLPYACKGGVCTTCKAKLLEGKVEMDINYGLEPEEVEAGYVLTCQSHPRTEKVVVNFDIK